MRERFPLADDVRFRLLVRALGGTGRRAEVVVTDDRFTARLGPFTVSAPRSEITGVHLSGPFSALKAIGVRLSLADRGLTFGTTDRGGVCVEFAHPVRGVDPLGLLRHPGLTVTVTDPEGLVAALS